MSPFVSLPPSSRLSRLAQQHALPMYCVLAFGLSWAYWLALLARGLRVGPGSGATHLPGLFGPFLAALAVTALADGGPGVKWLLSSCVRLPAPRWRWVLAATSPAWVGAAVFGVLAMFGQRVPSLQDFNTYPGMPQAVPLALAFLAALLVNGIGEEGGWRGFALPRLAEGRTPLRAALWVAAIWMLWHAPLFALNASMRQMLGPALVGWALGLAAGSLLLAWLYFHSRSVFVVAVWHTTFNFLVATSPGQGLVAAVASSMVIAVAAAVAVAWARRPHG